jgi:riboflavin kinase/FMN adenylyltransferase
MQPVVLSGTVTKYKGNGRKLGYPTANIQAQTELADGVYFGFANLATFKAQPALIFIGVPTTMGDTDRRVEVHLFDIPDQDYYGQTITAKLCNYYRPNQTFKSVDELLEVMRTDETAGRLWLAENPLGPWATFADTI